MVNELEGLPERVERVERKVDVLTSSVEERFDGVDQAFAEAHEFTQFASNQLRTEMHERFERVDRRFESVDARFESVDARFDRVDARFDGVDARFDRIDARFDAMDTRSNRLERKVDRILDHLTPKS